MWLSGYHSPGKMAEIIKELPSPSPGFVAVLLRWLMNSLLLFLPLYLLGRELLKLFASGSIGALVPRSFGMFLPLRDSNSV